MLSLMTDRLKNAQKTTRSLVADNLKALRRKKGLSQEALADLAGVHRTQIGYIERGTANLTLDNLTLMAETLGVKVIDLLNESPEEAPPLPTGPRPMAAKTPATKQSRQKRK